MGYLPYVLQRSLQCIRKNNDISEYPLNAGQLEYDYRYSK